MAGMNGDKENDNLIQNLEVCKHYYQQKKDGFNVTNKFSVYGDVAQINNNTYVDCGKNLIGMK